MQSPNLTLSDEIENNLARVNQRIHAAALACGREPHDITLLAVSKTKPLAALSAAFAAGQRHFGENYVQEGVEKIVALNNPDLIWHFIGPIQSNKTRLIAQHFAWVHSLDRFKIAERLSAHRAEAEQAGRPPLNVCIQVNIDNEASKSGVPSAEVLPLARQINQLPHLRLRGLMAIPQVLASGVNEAAFVRMQELFHVLKAQGEFSCWDTLSLGMSADLECAVKHASTMVRVGTDIFGQRDYSRQFE